LRQAWHDKKKKTNTINIKKRKIKGENYKGKKKGMKKEKIITNEEIMKKRTKKKIK
jgi:hypothetical protein